MTASPTRPQTLVVIGGDAAGATIASHVAREEPDTRVVMLEQGRYTSYSACGIPYYVGAELDHPDQLVARSPEQHRANGIEVHTLTRADAIDRDAKVVRCTDLRTGEPVEHPYDLLAIATGAHPHMPDIPGLAEHTVAVHTLDEGVELREELERRHASHVAILGGGYIGLEVAEAVHRRGLTATVVDRNPQVMRTLDPDMAEVVEQQYRRLGIDLLLSAEVTGVHLNPDKSCRSITTTAGEVDAEVVVLALGARARSELAAAAGIELGARDAIAVDGRMRTSVDGIWAAGDCATQTHLLTGEQVNVQLGTHANKTGKVAAIDIVARLRGEEGGDAVFPGVVGTAITKLCELEIGRTGLTEREARAAGIEFQAARFTGTARSGYMPDPGIVHVKVLAEEGTGRVIGAQMVGTGNVAKRIDVAAVWCQLGVTVQDAQLLDLSYAPPFGGVWDLLQVAARKLTRQLGLHPQL